MSKKFNATMFDRIKDALNKSASTSGGQFENIMKFPAGHTYVLRLLPTMEEGKASLFHHWINSWTSRATGTYTSTLALKTFGERDPITDLRWKLFKAWKDANPKAENKDYENELSEKEQWLINVYVVDDGNNPENNGTVKILRMGPQLKEIIDSSTTGPKSEELGWSIFDPTAGHDFKIVAEKNGDKSVFTTYKNSFFTTSSKTKLSEDDVDKIYEDLHDLEAVYTVKTHDELVTLLDDHFFCEEKAADKKEVTKAKKEADLVDEIPMVHDGDALDVEDLLDGLDLPS